MKCIKLLNMLAKHAGIHGATEEGEEEFFFTFISAFTFHCIVHEAVKAEKIAKS